MVAPSQAGSRDYGDREARQGVLELVFEGLVVEQVLGLDIEPEGPRDARSDRPGQDERRGLRGGVEAVAGHRGDVAELAVALDAVAGARESREEPMRWAVGEA